MEHPHAELARRLHSAIESADVETMRHTFAPDVVWHAGGAGPMAGDYNGINAVFDMFGRTYAMSKGTLRYDVHDTLADDKHTVVLLTVHASIAGRDLAEWAVHVCHVRDEAISEVWALQWTPDAFDEAIVEANARDARKGG